MDKIKLSDGTVLNISGIEMVKGILKISTPDLTVEKLAELFSDKSKTNRIILMTASEREIGFKSGFTSFFGINYDSEGTKTIELFQPVDVTEQRLFNAESSISKANDNISDTDKKVSEIEATVNTLLGSEVTANE